MKIFIQLLILLLLGFAHPVQASNWVELGRERVNAHLEVDVMHAANKGPMRFLALEVHGSAVYFESVTLHFGNGESMDWPIRNIIKAGQRSRVFDLPGSMRIIRRIVFHHKRLARHSVQPEVIVWGRQ